MTDIIVNLLSWLSSCIYTYFPAITVGDGALSKAVDAVAYLADLVARMNWIFPLPDAFLILSILFGIKLAKIVIFVVNWIVRRIFDLIP